jgi:hypothetical protein
VFNNKEKNLAPQKKFSEDLFIYLSIYSCFVKTIREGERELNKMYGNKLAGHAN